MLPARGRKRLELWGNAQAAAALASSAAAAAAAAASLGGGATVAAAAAAAGSPVGAAAPLPGPPPVPPDLAPSLAGPNSLLPPVQMAPAPASKVSFLPRGARRWPERREVTNDPLHGGTPPLSLSISLSLVCRPLLCVRFGPPLLADARTLKPLHEYNLIASVIPDKFGGSLNVL